ncbi:Hypothetical protein CINCED_3A014028 [Cinara cedri]|uniref:Uncharacterized protein n=1 Tax=Cinara cedri TaxID=506608 RepID=A0A5E4NI76_9HEMI|nr:Hypothetical protein CINCED_3A014028 [Cinara cedri]
MFVSKKSNLNEWKNWAIGLVGNTMSSIDQATSRWFWNLINGLPRDYFAKAFDQVNYLDKRVWEGMFRANIEEIKEQLELGVSESIVEANLVKLQGLVGKYSLSPVIYENGLEELEDFISNLSNAGNYLKVLKGIRSEFREELKSQPALLKECIEGEANLGRKEGEYYKSLLDDRSLKNVSPERVISESPILDKATVSKRGNNNYKLRNISKLLFSNPGQALTLFLAAQSAFASAANIQMKMSETTTGNFLETIELAEFLQKKFILPMDIGIGVSEQASILFYNMKNSINEIAKGNLKNIILSYDNISYCQTTLFSNGVYFLDENLFKRLIRETVSDLYGKVNINRMLECLLHDLSVEKSIEVCEIVIYKLGAKHFPNDDTLKLAVYIKNITESHYSQATSERVFTCTSSGEIQNGKWQFELAHSMYYYIRNINNGKYLYPIQRPSGTAPYELKRREVFARDGKAEWEVLFTSDGVRLRSVNLGEYYLYSSSRSYYNSHEVFIGGKLSEFGNIRITSWKFEDCGNSRRRRDVKEVQDVRNSTEESLQENINPSAQISDITLERVKITDKNISFTGR